MSETYKSVIVIDKENRSEILDQDVSIRHLVGFLWKHCG